MSVAIPSMDLASVAAEWSAWDPYHHQYPYRSKRPLRVFYDVAGTGSSDDAVPAAFVRVSNATAAATATTLAHMAQRQLSLTMQVGCACEEYGSLALAAGSDTDMHRSRVEVLYVEQVPYTLSTAALRWVLQRLTGVTALKIEQRRNRSTRGRTGLFTAVVRAEDADAVVAAHHRALCCAEFLWVPACDAAEAEELCARLRTDDGGLVKNGLLSVARRRPQRDAVPQELHVVESERRRPLVWQTLSVRHLSVVPVRALRRDDSLTYQMIQ